MSETKLVRWVRWLLVCALFGAAASCGDAPETSGVVPLRSTPAKLAASSEAETRAAWALFDRDTKTGWTPATSETGYAELRLSLDRARQLAYVKVHGSSGWSLSVATPDGATLAGLEDAALDQLGAGWNILLASGRPIVRELVLRWTALGEPGPIPELELWTLSTELPVPVRAADLRQTLDATTSEAPELPAHVDVHAGLPSELLLASSGSASKEACASVSFSLLRPPAVYRRAWVAYSADGAFRPFVLTRALNTGAMRRGQWMKAASDSGPSSFVEPIDPETLREGTNRLDFCLPVEAKGSVLIHDLSFIGETEHGANHVEWAAIAPLDAPPTDAAPELLDPESDATRTVTPAERIVVGFERFVSPDLVVLETTSSAWAIDCLDAAGSARPLTATADEPDSGRIPFFVHPEPDAERACAGLALRPASDAAVGIAGITVLGSGAKRRIDWPRITLASAPEHFGRIAWVDGWASAPSDLGGAVRVEVDAQDVGTQVGVYGRLLERTGDPETAWPVTVTARLSNGTSYSQQFLLDRNGEIDPDSLITPTKPGGLSPEESKKRFGAEGASKTENVDSKNGGSIWLGTHVGVDFPPGALNKDTEITVKHLSAAEVPPLDPGMVNVTAPEAHAYEFLPHGQSFKKPVEITLPFDAALIPEGYLPEEVQSYFYDDEVKRWQRLAKKSLDPKQGTAKSLTDHFTVMINAVVVAPEHPQIRQFNPNEIRDIQAADPGARVNLIEPPEANPRGDAVLSYPFELPPGRRGLEPRLALSYDSSRGNGWVGMGWDLPLRAITLDTRWGAARYHPTQESDTYLLEGEMLAPFAHRDPTIARNTSGKKTFHTRVEGEFRKIVRHGNTPSTYWWEVTDKTGTKYFYGAIPEDGSKPDPQATLGASAPNPGIFLWALKEIRDTHGNSIRYTYAKPTDAGFSHGSVPGFDLYPKSIGYTFEDGASSAPYTVVFTRDREKNEPKRADVIVDGRGGFKRVTADLLRRIDVYFGTQRVRAWQLAYTTGAFHKTLLSSVTQLGATDLAFPGNVHTFSYFDEIRDPADPDEYKGFAQAKSWEAGADTIPSGVQIIPGTSAFSPEVTMLGAAKSSGSGVHSYIGFNPTLPTKQGSGGFKVGSSRSKSEGRTQFLDIDGDGLPDKVFRQEDGSFVYRRNVSGPALGLEQPGSFQDKRNLEALPLLSADRSNTRSSGGEAYPSPFMIAANRARTFTRGTGYLSDVNGDGLPDVVSSGVVRFNRPTADGQIFDASSALTPLPIVLGTPTDSGLLPGYNDLIQELSTRHPLVDTVRIWTAPYNGVVTVTAPVKRLETTTDGDALRVAIQHNENELWSATIPRDSTATFTPTGVDQLAVLAGDRIYFRLGSLDDGKKDAVTWSPVVEYAQHAGKLDANALDQGKYFAGADFVMGGRTDAVLALPFDGQVRITGLIGKKVTSDSVTLSITRTDPTGIELLPPLLVDTRGPTDTTAWNVDLTSVPVAKNERIRVRFVADSPVDLGAIEMTPPARQPVTVTYLSATQDGNDVPVVDGNQQPLFVLPAPLDMDIYSAHKTWPPVVLAQFVPAPVFVVPDPKEPPKPGPKAIQQFELSVVGAQAPLSTIPTPAVYFTIKREAASGPAALLHKQLVSNGPTIILASNLPELKEGDRLFFEASTRTPELIMPLQVTVTVRYQDNSTDIGFTAHHFKAADTECSRPYRGWGYGAYNGSRGPTDPLPDPNVDPEPFFPNSFCFARAEATGPAPTTPEEADTQGEDLKKKTINFPLMPFPAGRKCQLPDDETCAIPSGPLWGGSDELVYVTPTRSSSTRHGAEEITVPKPEELVGPHAVVRLTDSRQNGVTVGGGPVSVNHTEGPATSIVDYMDMNGDGFPDVIGQGGIQYTSSRGTLQGGLQGNASTARKSQNEAFSAGIGGGFPIAKVNTRGRGGTTPQTGAQGAGNEGQMAELGFTLDVGDSLGTTSTEYDFMDVNGDGLPDRVAKAGSMLMVQLNLGYAFAAPEPFDVASPAAEGAIHAGNNQELTLGANLGFNDLIYGFGGGLSATSGSSKVDRWGFGAVFQPVGLTAQLEPATLLDINGDGLLDRITYPNSTARVAINMGSGFAPPTVWGGMIGGRDVTESENRNRGAGGYFTIAIGFVSYAIVNPGADTHQGVQRQEATITDVNGDGYPDHVESDGPNHFRAALSQIGKTNLLASVKRPLGAEFSLDYRRTGNTFEHPQSRWVVSRVVTADGLAGDFSQPAAAADYQLTTYDYESGFYDRFEREFYGFAKVTETEHDTRGFAAPAPLPPAFFRPYRTTARAFHNDTFFSKGLLVQETVDGVDSEPTGTSGRFTDVVNTYVLVEHDTENDTTKELTDPDAIKHTPFPVFPELRTTVRKVHEGNFTDSLQTTMQYAYDRFGNVTKLVDSGDASTASDDFVATITYTGATTGDHTGCAANHIVGLADTITVTSLTSQLLRHRKAKFNCSTGDLLELSQSIDAVQTAVSNFTYQQNGNLATAEGPENLHTDRYLLAFEYDAKTQTHVTKVTDSFGYVSTAEYDDNGLRFGESTAEIDLNGNRLSRHYDDYGRLDTVTGPYEQGSQPYTIRFTHVPDAAVPFAVTEHVDVFRNPADPIVTILFTDGLKRVVQTKKDATIHAGKDASPVDMMIVSGRVAFDHLGRTIEAFYPKVEPQGLANFVFDPNPDSGAPPTTTKYDVMNRVRQTVIPDGTATSHAYTLSADKLGLKRLTTTTTDAEGQVKVTYRDIRDLIRAIQEFNAPVTTPIWTLYDYDPLQQLVAVQDDHANLTKVAYDLLGRRTVIDNPDTGKTQMVYDPASNLTQKITANLAAQSKSILYDYDFNRLKSITYPSFDENDVAYTYGGPALKGKPGNLVGRIIKVTDESGTEERAYGKLGEIVQETKTVASDTQGKSETAPETWTTKYLYDTWGRLQQMTYHDGEVLTYAYDSGGLPRAATGKKLGITYPYVEKLEYDKFEQRAFLKEGNGVETAYTYNPLDRRLDRLQAGAPNDPNGDFQDLSYSYDDVGNILKLDNTAKIPKAGDYGGPVTQTFQYDGLYRLTKADGTWRYDPNKKSVYSFSQSYDTIHNITKKTQTHDVETPGGATVPQKKTSYDLTYSYTSSHPHAPTKISGTDDVHKGGRTFEYDKNGNQLGFDVINSGQKRSIVWDEENRIQEIHDNGRTSRFKYNDAGERVIKRTEQGETAYVNQFWTVRNRSVGTKHIFVGETRIASKLVPGEDHVQPESLWSQTLGGWWKQLSQGQKPFKNPHFTGSSMPQKLPEDNFVYFYHPDHVGSTSYVTDKDGELYEHVQYFPFGETWVHEHSNTEKLPYLYTSKELDEETGLYYFGARYYDPRTSVWQSADPAFRNYLSGGPSSGVYASRNLAVYCYAWANPTRLTDERGEYVIQEGQNVRKWTYTQLALQEIVGHYGVVTVTTVGQGHVRFDVRQTQKQYDAMRRGGDATRAVRDLARAMQDKKGVYYIYNATASQAESDTERRHDKIIRDSRGLAEAGGASTALNRKDRTFFHLPIIADIAVDYDMIPMSPFVSLGAYGAGQEMTHGLALGHELLGHGVMQWAGRLGRREEEERATAYENRYLRPPKNLAPRAHDVVVVE